MCKPCKAGGAFESEAKAQTLPGNRAFWALEAISKHEVCEHPKTCSCQHRVGGIPCQVPTRLSTTCTTLR